LVGGLSSSYTFLSTKPFAAAIFKMAWQQNRHCLFSLPIRTDTDIYALLKQCLFCLIRQNKHSGSYFAFIQAWVVELVTWQVWNAWLAQLIVMSVTIQSDGQVIG